MNKFRHLKVGDKVTRQLGAPNGVDMEMVVTGVDDRYVYCDASETHALHDLDLDEHWKFDRDLGCEEDEDLGWGRNFGRTGSFLKTEDQKDGTTKV